MPDTFQLDPSRALVSLRSGGPQMAQRITEAIRAHAPVGKGSPDHQGGGLRDGLAGKVLDESNGGLRIGITSDKDYANYVVRGTQPHVIEARNARALRFWVEGDTLRFATRVNHPGTQANPFFRQATDEIRSIVQEEVGRAMRTVLRP